MDLARAFFTGAEKVFARLHLMPHRDDVLDLGSSSGRWRDLHLSGQLVSTKATGTAPMTVASTTKVANLNADLLDDLDTSSDTYNASVAKVLATDADGGARVDHWEVGNVTGAGEGDVSYAANLHPTRGGTEYTGYVYVPCTGRVTALSWSTRDAGTYTVDTSALGLPTVKAVMVLLSIQWAAASDSIYAAWRHPDYVDLYGIVRSYVAGSLHDHVSVVPCNASGDFNLYIAGANATGSEAYILGYYI